MANFFDQYDGSSNAPSKNFFDQYDKDIDPKEKDVKISGDAGLSFSDALRSGAKEFFPDVARTAVEMIEPFLNPKETAKAVKNLVIGTAQKITPGVQEFEKYPDAVWEGLVDEYGDLEAIKNTIATRPAKVLLDASSILSGGGAAVRGAGLVSKSKKISDIGKSIQKVGAAIEPISALKTSSANIAKAIAPNAPRSLYEGAAKFSKTLDIKDRIKHADTALKHNLLPNYKGVDKALGKIWDLKRQVDDKVSNLTLGGKRIDPNKLIQDVDPLRRKYTHGMAKTNLRAIDKVVDEVMYGAEILQKNGTLSPTEVNNIKRSLYNEINFVNKKRSTPAKQGTQEAVAKSAKKSLEALDPTIKPTNREMGDLLGLMENLPQSAARIADKNIIGLGMPVKMAVGAKFGPVGEAAGLGAGIMDIPQVKARMALGMKNAASVSPIRPVIRQGLFQTDQATDDIRKRGLLDKR